MNLATTDLTDFMQLPDAVRKDVEAWHHFFATQITPPIQRALENIARSMGSTYGTARRKYDAWRKSGWRGLVNRSKVRDVGSALTPEFTEWWKTLCQQNGRKCLPAYREFVRRFKAGEPIPGIGPCVPRGSIPAGFSYDNLMRYRPTKFETAVGRVGILAASPFRPKVLATRRDLAVGQYIMFDDMWHDFKVVAIGQRRPMRLLQLHAHDLYSGCQFARGLKARVEDPETGKSLNLNQDEMLFLVAHILGEYGFYEGGCVLIVEHGTAAIPEWLEKLLFDLSNRKITVERSGIVGATEIAGQYAGLGKGNFRFKAHLESLGNLIHNETANLLTFPGQTGSNSRINAPEELAGREHAMDPLAKALLALPQHVATQLRLPFLEVATAKWAVEEIMERINRRTDHDLEGWDALRTVDYRLPSLPALMSGLEVLRLPDQERNAFLNIAEQVPRKLSPREVFDAGRGRLVKFAPDQVAYLLKDKRGREVTVGDDHLITFEDSSISPEPFHYQAHHFAPGRKFLAVVNPWSPENLHLFDAAGRWVGVVDLWQRVSRLTDDLKRQMGAAAKIQSQLLAPYVERGAEIMAKRLDDTRHNIDKLRPSPEHRAYVKKHGPAAAEDILATPSPGGEGRGEGELPISAGDDLLSALSNNHPQK